jgi:hypothetical protein
LIFLRKKKRKMDATILLMENRRWRPWNRGSGIVRDGFMVHHIHNDVMPRRVQCGLVDLDSSSLFERVAELKSSGLDSPYPWSGVLTEFLERSIMESLFASLNRSMRRVQLSEPLKYYGSMLASQAIASVATQPLNVVKSVQSVQLDSPIRFSEAWRCVRQNEQKTFYDGLGAHIAHEFCRRAVQDWATCAISSALGLRYAIERPIDARVPNALERSAVLARQLVADSLLSGLVARVGRFVGDVVCAPLSTIRWRLEVQGAIDALPAGQAALDVLRGVHANGGGVGWRALFGIDHLAYGLLIDLSVGALTASVAYALCYLATSERMSPSVRETVVTALCSSNLVAPPLNPDPEAEQQQYEAYQAYQAQAQQLAQQQ